MNNYFIKIQGKANIPEPLSIGHNYTIVNDCSITSEQKCDNDDGTFDIIYKAEPLTMTVQKDNGEIIKAQDPRKNSLKFRNYLFKVYTNEGVIEGFDEIYDEVTLVAMSRMNELVTEAVKRIEERN